MKGFIIVKKKIEEFFYPSLKSAEKDIDEDSSEIIVEVEVQEIRRFKKGDWQEIK